MLALVMLLAYVPWALHGFGADSDLSRPAGTVTHFTVSGRWVALAFALDGSQGAVTAHLAQEVASSGDYATFFVVGLNVWKEQASLRRARQLGDDIESHSEGHINLAAHSYAADLQDLARANRAIERATGQRPRWLLPPYGAVSGSVVRAAHALGLGVILPSVGESIAAQTRRPSTLAQDILAHLTPGAILVLSVGAHDHLLVQELPTLLDLLRLDGYHVGSVGQLARRSG
ncbi:MAG: hypothetical protein C7B45_15295 [Sulfobacillus acidophilus]|uniref:NodB homology domain-containing protein n=1 Tax=Sulfobacillus acidophilus TaxID=53633 RepID=A0A2T2WDP8_9FIRM|nr:MAG: hypothetical protein C7B45_15295 [Sulfobacillus acidophilus]